MYKDKYVAKSCTYDPKTKEYHWEILGYVWAENFDDAVNLAHQLYPNHPGALYVMAEWPD